MHYSLMAKMRLHFMDRFDYIWYSFCQATIRK